MSGKIPNTWLLGLCAVVLMVSGVAATILLVDRFLLWRAAIIMAALLIGIVSVGLFIIFALALAAVRRGRKS